MHRVRALLNENNREFTTRALNIIEAERMTAKSENWLPLLKAYTDTDSQVVSFEVVTEKKPSDSIVFSNIDTFVDWMRDLDCNFGVKYRTAFKSLYKQISMDSNHREILLRIKEDFGIRTDGVKLTKVMSRVLDKVLKDAEDKKPHIVAEVKKAIEKVGDSMKTKQVTETVKISVELFDYLRMSHGNSWESCHSIRDGGSWQSGTISYALDKFTAIAYIEGQDGDLITRCCLHLHPKGIIIGRNYGSKNKESIIKAVQMLLDTDDSRVDDFNCENIRRGGTAYADWLNDDGYNTLIELPLPIDVSAGYGERPICIDCGKEHWEEGSLLCDSCTHIYCEECGEEIDEDDALWVDGRRACTHCASYCNHCDEWHLEGNMLTGTDARGRRQEFCQSCYDETQCICEDCGESMHNDLMYWHEGDGEYYCENCIDDHPDSDPMED